MAAGCKGFSFAWAVLVSLALSACDIFNSDNVDSTPPSVASVLPPSAATNVAATTTVSVNFSEAINCTSVTAASFTLTGAAPVTGNISCAGSSATFTPATALALNTLHTVNLSTAVKDLAGNALASAFSSNFTTAAAPPANFFTVGGTLTGLAAGQSVVLQNNLADNLTLNADGLFTFATPIASGAAYNVTVLTQPAGQTCSVANASGMINANVTNVAVTCVNNPNAAPSFIKGPDQSVLEDAGAQSVANWATAIDDGDPAFTQTLTFNVTGNTNPGLFSVAPAIAANGTLSYTPAANANGSATITLVLQDNGGTANGGVDTSAAQTFTITVNAVNDVPSFTKGADQSVLEDNGPQSVAGWATGISPGPADEAAQTLTFNITGNTSPALFSAGPAVAADGTLTYTPAPNANGSATITIALQDNGGTANGGVDTSATQSFVINVTAVNDAPSFTKGPDQSVAEGSGLHTIANWATNISPGPANESGQTALFFVTGNTNPGLFSVAPAVAADGSLTYTLAANGTGSATITLALQDNGGTANGGVDTFAQTFVITVFTINQAPSFTKGADQTVLEDAGAQSVPAWATGINDGNPTVVQTVTFVVTNNTNAALFSAGPAVAANGTLTYTPAANANGTATITLVLQDNGGTANGGVDTSAPQTFVITVNAVNDAPSFTAVNPPTVNEEAGAQSVAGWATFNPGPADESGQTVLSYSVSAVSNGALFSVAPSVAANGTLTYTPAANAFGSSTFQVTVRDSGGGIDVSAAQTFTITVNGVNDAPSFTKGADQTVLEDAGAQSVASWATGISAGPANEAGQTLSFGITNNTNPGLFSAGPAVAANGTLTYTPAANANGSATITLRVQDNGGTANGGVDSSPTQSFNINVTAVNDPPVAQNKSGISAQTHMTVTGINANLLSGVTDADTGVNGCAPVFSVASITASSGGTVANVNLGAGTFDFNPAPGFTGTAVVNYTVADTGCPAPGATSAAATISITVSGPVIWFVDDNAAGGGNGTLASPFTTLANADAVDADNHRIFLFSGTYTNGLTLRTGEWLIGQGVTGASFDAVFGITPPTGTIARPSINGTRPLVQASITVGTNSSVRGLDINTAAVTGMSGGVATGVTVSEVSIVTSTAAAVNLNGTDGVFTFTSVSASGGANGIVLQNTGANFNFTVTGTGVLAGSGGTIQNVTGADGTTNGIGIYLNNTRNVSLARMQLNGFQNFAIRGLDVVNFSMSNSVVSGVNGTSATENEGSISFGAGPGEPGGPRNGLTGTATVANSSISGGFEDNFRLVNTAGVLNRLVFDTVTMGLNSNSGNDSILIEGLNNATLNVTVQNSTFTGAAGDLFNYVLNGNNTGDLVFTGNTLSNNHPVIATGGGGVTVVSGNNVAPGATFTFNMSNNSFRDAVGTAVLIAKSTDPGTVTGTFANNSIGVQAVANSGSAEGSGLKLQTVGLGTMTVAVTNNVIRQYNNFGIEVLTGGAATAQSGAMNVTMAGNTIANPGNTAGVQSFPKNGIHLNAGTVPGDTYQVCLRMSGNAITGSGLDAVPATIGNIDFRLRQRQATTVRLPGYTGANNDNAAVIAFVQGNNGTTPTGNVSNTVPTGGGFIGTGTTCP